MTRDDPFDLVGDVLDGQYRVDAVAGEGDLSVVYKGHHLGVDAPVAIKCLNLPATLDPALVRPLVDDFREASRVHYRLARGSLHIAQSLGSGQTIAPRTGATVPFLVREWFEGESLAAGLARRRSEGLEGRLIEEAVTLLEPAIEAIAYAHDQGTPHLSVNPSNLFMASKDGASSLVVLDFGVARTMNELTSGLPAEARSTRGLRVLFPGYAAPEQLDRTVGETGPWTDVYALALVFMELLSDRVVMHGSETGALVERALHEEKRPTPAAHGLTLARDVELVLTRAVAKNPAERQKDARAFWRDVTSVARGAGSRAVAKAPAAAARAALAPTPTLLGISPSSSAVVGAVRGRPRAPSAPRIETKPMSFEPSPPSAEEPPPAEEPFPPKVVTAKLPPPPASVNTLPAWAVLPRRAPSPGVAIAVVACGSFVMLGLATAVIALVVAALHRQASAATPEMASQAPAALAVPSAASAFSASPSAWAPPPPSAVPVSAARFSAAAAKQALDAVSRDVARCKRGLHWGRANATVTFDSDGSVKHVHVGAPFTGTSTGRCVGDLLASARVPPFAGDPVVYATQFYVAPR
jgi:serine/threonine protein kinase